VSEACLPWIDDDLQRSKFAVKETHKVYTLCTSAHSAGRDEL